MGAIQSLPRQWLSQRKRFAKSKYPVYAHLPGPLVLIGFGSIGRGILPLIQRHLTYDKSLFTIVDPLDTHKRLAEENGIRFLQVEITPENYAEVLTPLLKSTAGQGFCLNLAVNIEARAIMSVCRKVGAIYLDADAEPWPDVYFDKDLPACERTIYAFRQALIDERESNPGGPTAITCCGANPGSVSWMVKQALLNIAADLAIPHTKPTTREEWGALMRLVGIKGVHIAERDTQCSRSPKPPDVFVNTWSIDGFLSEAMQPAELGWGTHEKWRPTNAHDHAKGSGCAIYLMQHGAETKVRSWTPTAQAQLGLMIPHNECVTLSDYFTLRDEAGEVVYRPTVNFAYHPCNDTILSLHELFGQANDWPDETHILDETEIVDGVDELGVLLYGHAKNAYWFGSRLSIQQTRRLAPGQNATGLQVAAGVLAGMVWAVENPNAGLVESEELDYERCLEVQRPYLGDVFGVYTDWTPLEGRPGIFPEDLDESDPWQFRNVLVH